MHFSGLNGVWGMQFMHFSGLKGGWGMQFMDFSGLNGGWAMQFMHFSDLNGRKMHFQPSLASSMAQDDLNNGLTLA